MAKSNINLNKILIDSQSIEQEELDGILSLQEKTGKGLKELLIEKGLLSEEEFISVVAYYLTLPFIEPDKFKIDPAALKLIPEDMARKLHLMPLYKVQDTLLVVLAEPLDILSLDNLRLSLGCEIRQFLARDKAISELINNYYSEAQSLPEILDSQQLLQVVKTKKTDDAESANLIEESQKQPVIRAVNLVLNEAIEKRASDIHIEPTEEDLRVRYRIDGILCDMHSLPKASLRGISARIKILSNLDITKFYLPQDGRFHVSLKGKEIDFRVSSLPTIYGEKFVLRILDKAKALVSLEQLGISPQPLSLLKEAISKDHGMILITGPTGSGKSTTLYSILSRINSIERHIVTVEDPVEYQMEGLSQIHVRPEIGLTFAAALRALLRQSPDTIMIGEIRDTETADIAIKASLIGQLILSTLHTNDAVSAFARLVDMGIERYLVASSLILVCAQRLCRTICSECKEKLENPPETILNNLGISLDKKPTLYYGKGCDSCNHTGYKGRTALLEALKVDSTIKNMIIREVSLDDVKEAAIKQGNLITLKDDGLNKALSGETTIEEIYRITARD